MNTTLITALCLATGLGMAQAGEASAHSSPTTYSQAVKVSDLDLSQEQDARTLVDRIRLASNRVCRRATGAIRPLSVASSDYYACVREARSRAVAELNHPMVTAIHNGASPIEVAQK